MDSPDTSTRPPIKGTEFIGPFRLGEQIGKGGMAVVKLGTYAETDTAGNYPHLKKVAIKIIHKSKLSNVREQTSMAREITIMKLLYHPNILQLFDLYEDDSRIFLVLEYWPGGDLYHHIAQRGPLKLTHAHLLFSQLIDAVDFCHQNQIVHRDLKPENLLLSKDAKRLALSDFGLSTGTQGGRNFLTTRCGSVHYISPEVAQGSPYQGTKSDIWSCGIILYAMTTASLPFEGDSPVEVLKKVVKGDFLVPSTLPPSLQRLISDMLTTNPNERLSIAQIRKNQWIIDGMGSISIPPIPHRSPRVTPLSERDLVENEAILDNLSLLGWDRDTLKAMLLASEINDAKVFYALLRDHQKGRIARAKQLPVHVPPEDDRLAPGPHLRRRAHSSAAGLTAKKNAKTPPKINIVDTRRVRTREPRVSKDEGEGSPAPPESPNRASGTKITRHKSGRGRKDMIPEEGTSRDTSPCISPKDTRPHTRDTSPLKDTEREGNSEEPRTRDRSAKSPSKSKSPTRDYRLASNEGKPTSRDSSPMKEHEARGEEEPRERRPSMRDLIRRTKSEKKEDGIERVKEKHSTEKLITSRREEAPPSPTTSLRNSKENQDTRKDNQPNQRDGRQRSKSASVVSNVSRSTSSKAPPVQPVKGTEDQVYVIFQNLRNAPPTSPPEGSPRSKPPTPLKKKFWGKG